MGIKEKSIKKGAINKYSTIFNDKPGLLIFFYGIQQIFALLGGEEYFIIKMKVKDSQNQRGGMKPMR